MIKKTRFGYIAPTEYLHLIPESATFHLILAHLLKDKRYADYYKAKIERGDTVICDNGAFEFKKSLDAEPLMKMIKDSGVEPTYVVAPDYPFEHWKVTYESTKEFIELAAGEKYGIMAVPQSKTGDYKGWIKGYTLLCNLPSVKVIGMSILGIPNAFCELTGTNDIATNRIFATAYLKDNGLVNEDVSHHYLGLGDGPRELITQRALGVMDTNDSSSPFWHGIQGISLDDTATGLVDGKTPIEVDFDLVNTNDEEVDRLILSNVEWMEKIIGNK
jgi:hypothetical protein